MIIDWFVSLGLVFIGVVCILRRPTSKKEWDSNVHVAMPIGAKTEYIVSTSGRASSMRRYRCLLRQVLHLDIAYIPIHGGNDRISAKNFCAALLGLRALGGAISRDIKSSVLHEIDEVDDIARAVGAVNTVIRSGDKLIGYNTDAEGLRVALESSIKSQSISKVLIYGYGGVTHVAVAVLKSMGISDISLTGRRLDAVYDKSKELDVASYNPNTMPSPQPDLFINCAPVTDSPLDQAPFFLQALRGARFVFDHELVGIYLKEYCSKHAIVHIPGTCMYWPQMHAQWRLFLKDRLPPARLSRLLESLKEADRLASS